MAIGAVIGIISAVVQAVRALSPPETQRPQQAADRLFDKLNEMGQGTIGSAEMQTAFEKIKTDATGRADKLFTKLDADGDGRLTKNEFSDSINQLAEQLDQHYMRIRLHGEGGMPQPPGHLGFTKEELTAQITGIVSNFDKADTNGDGRVSLQEAKAMAQSGASATASPLAATSSQNVELMLQVVRLMQAYGIVGGSTASADNGTIPKVSNKV